MRRSLILPLLEQQVRIIGQLHHDTALFFFPESEPKRRGRRRKYGPRINAAVLNALPTQTLELTLYGRLQSVRLGSTLAVARFLKGVPACAVWCEMGQDDDTWSRLRLILAAELYLSARTVVELYAQRWGIEPLFHNLKRWWGVANLWQQSKEALELWMQIRSMAYALTQMLALRLRDSFPLMDIAPWRKGAIIAAGLFGQWLRIQSTGLRARGLWRKVPTIRHALAPPGSAAAVLSKEVSGWPAFSRPQVASFIGLPREIAGAAARPVFRLE
jgi:hypothetical protein